MIVLDLYRLKSGIDWKSCSLLARSNHFANLGGHTRNKLWRSLTNMYFLERHCEIRNKSGDTIKRYYVH